MPDASPDPPPAFHADTIERPDDPRLEVFRDVRDRDLRSREGLFMAESERVLRRLVRRPERLHSVLLSPGRRVDLDDLVRQLPPEVPVHVAPMDIICRIAGFHVHRGVLAAGRRPRSEDLTIDAALGHLAGRPHLTILVAEGITNVDNIGGLFRNAAAFGVDGVLIDPTCCDPLYRKAIRVSAGHVLSTPWAMATEWPADLIQLRERLGVSLVAAELTQESRPTWEIDAFGAARTALVFGSEARGVSADALAACDAVAEIPMAAGVPSLNVATSSAVMLYERQRRVETGLGGPGGGGVEDGSAGEAGQGPGIIAAASGEPPATH
ncbi:MAG: TrmH family RNA methyltransferase [Phycisphaerales bacterium]